MSVLGGVEPTIKIQNIQATADIGHSVDLDEVMRRMDGTKYNPKRFPCVVARLTQPKSCMLIFRTGKIVCTGTTATKDTVAAVAALLVKVRACGIDVRGKPTVKVSNVVATADLHCRIHIDDAAAKLPRSIYEPELFAGLIHRMLDPKVAVLLFASGRMVCAGAKSEKAVRRAVYVARSALLERGLVRYEFGT